MVDGDWSVDRATGNIRYIGFDHSPTTTVAAGAFVTGDYYQIRSVGTTDFTLVGAPDNNVGTRFEATGAGTGTGVATQASSYATVIQFHRWLQALADDPEFAGDDELDIIDRDPSSRSTDNIITLTNGFNVDATAIEHLYDGSITQGVGPTQERWDGVVNFGNSDIHIQIIQNGSILSDDYWNAGWQAGTHTGAVDQAVLTDSTASWTTNEWVGYWIKNVTDGSVALITANTATTITGLLFGGTDNDWDTNDVYNIQVPINSDSAQGISHRFMIKVRDFGVDIGRRRLLGTSRRWSRTYSEFSINGTNPGNNVLALSDSSDLNNTTAWATVAGWTTITNTEGLRLIDISGDGTNEQYYSEWNRDTFTINQFYERMKYLSGDTTPETLNGQSGELHRGPNSANSYDTETGAPAAATNAKWVYGTYVNHGAVTGGPFVVGEAVHEDTATPVWKGRVLAVDTVATSLIIDIEFGTVTISDTFTGQTSGAQATVSATPAGEEIQNAAGEIAIFALDDQGTAGFIYGQITKGVQPLNNTRLYDPTAHTAYYTLDTAAIERPISTPFCGVSTGSALIGAYGFGMEAADTSAADTFFDLQNNAITPPNNVTFTVSGFIAGDYVLVTEDNGGDINFTQMALNATLSGAAVTSVPINPAPGVPTDTPTSAGTKGSIRIQRNNSLYSLHRYTAFDAVADTFTIPSTDFSTNNATAGNNVFIGYLDYVAVGTSDNFSYVYSSDRTHFVRVRDGGATPIKTAETTGVMTNTGGTASVNRIDDT
jgi:hypothetical protein